MNRCAPGLCRIELIVDPEMRLPPNTPAPPSAEPPAGSPDSGDDETIYRVSQRARRGAWLQIAGFFAVAALALGGGLESWWDLLDAAASGSPLLLMAAHSVRAEVRVSDTAIRKVRPAMWDQEVRLENVERALLTVTQNALWLYTTSTTAPQLAVKARAFERFDDLVLQVLDCLPDAAVVEDPADRVAAIRGGDAQHGSSDGA